MVPLIVSPKGARSAPGGSARLDVQRTFLTARSIEFHAILVAGAVRHAKAVAQIADLLAAHRVGEVLTPVIFR